MKKHHIVFLSFLIIVAAVTIACTHSEMYGEQNDRALKLYEEKQKELYEIIDFFDRYSIDIIEKEPYYDGYIKIDNEYYIRFQNGGKLTETNRNQISRIVEFMKQNKIHNIYNDSESDHLYFHVTGWTRSVSLIYAPNDPDIDKIRRANFCNAHYIDKSWILLDYYDEDYWSVSMPANF